MCIRDSSGSAANTTLLLNGTNANIIDQTGAINIVPAGSARISTTTSKFGTGSIVLDGSTGYLTTGVITYAGGPSSAPLILGGADFTVEAFVYINSLASSSTLYALNSLTTAFAGFRFDILTSGAYQLLLSTSGSAWAINYTSPTGLFTTGQWYHLAIVRSGSSF